jgi:hypothetical protein
MSMTKEQIETIAQLRHDGYAVIIWTPEELDSAPPHKVEDRSIELGWDIIECLRTGDEEEEE